MTSVALTIAARRLSARLARALPVLLLLAPAPAAGADIAFDHSSESFARPGSRSLTWKHTLGTGADRALLVSVAIADRRRHNADITSVTFDGVAMHAVSHSYAADAGPRILETQLFYLIGSELPGPGRYSVTVRFDDDADAAAGGAVSLFGVQPGAPAAAATEVDDPGIGPIRNHVLAPLDSWIVDLVASESSASLTPGHGQVERFDDSEHRLHIAGSTEPASPSGTTTLTWDQRGPSRLVTSAVAFAARTFTLTLSTQGAGAIQSNPPGNIHRSGTSVTLTAVPAPGWQFAGWSGDLTGTTNPASVTMDAAKSVTATFTQIFFTLQTSTVGSGSLGVDPPASPYAALSSVTLTAVPAAGWQFLGWSGDLSGYTNPASLTMDGDKSVTATFTPIPPPVITAPPDSQVVSVGGGASFSVTATGIAPLTYQWRKNGAPIAGATADTLALANVQLTDAGSYTVAVGNAGGTTLSAPAALSVTSAGGVIVASDSFADAERLTLALPSSATWLKSQASTAVTMAPGSAQFTWNTTSADMIAGYFSPAGSPVSLGIGDTLTLSVTFAFTGLGSGATPTPALRFGMLDSQGSRPADNVGTSNAAYVGDTGYGLFTSMGTVGSGTAFTFNRRTTTSSNNIFNTGADFTTITPTGGGTARAFADNTDYVLTYTITRLSATQTRLAASIVGGTLPSNYAFATTETNANPYTSFDYFGWRVASSNFAAAITFKNLSVTLGLVPPSITTPPASVSTVEFTNVVLTAAASGSGPLTFQWNKDGEPIPGATSPTLTLTGVHVADSGAYTLTATNPVGSVTSALANVVVGLAPPLITSQPLSQTILVGDPATFSVGVSGSAPFTYQWRKDGFDIAGATGPSFTIPSLQLGDSGVYQVTVTNDAASVPSAPATLLVTLTPVPPSITAPPVPTTVVVGNPTELSVTASGTTPLFYQWSRDDLPIAGATGPVYAIASASDADAGSYTVTVTNSVSSMTSAPALLTVVTPPTITTPPSSQVVNAGTTAVFSVAASGSAPLAYQWRKNGTPIAGANADTLTLGSVTAAAAGAYSVVVSNAGGSVTSASATLTVADPNLGVTALFPANGGTGLPVDASLKITFGIPPSLGSAGLIQIRDAATSAVVDTIDLAAPSQTKTIGGVVYNYLPVIVNGNVALITPHVALGYNKTYAATLEAGVFRTTNGVFSGISGSAWLFSTKPAPPAADATTLVVAADGTADFATVQGAIDFVPTANALRRLIAIRRGTYQELVHVNNKPLITLRGESRLDTFIAYANNSNFNPSARAAVGIDAADVTVENLTLRNLTPKGGSQAEALRTNGLRFQLRNCDLYSFQDTLQLNGSAHVESSYVEGDVDFMWGNAAAYFSNSELKNVTSAGYYVQSRTPAGQPGFVYVGSRLSGAPGVTGTWLARIDPVVFPDSQVVYIDSAIGPQVAPPGWLLNNATSSSTIRFWEYGSTDLAGATLDVSQRIASSRQLTAPEATQWSDPTFVLGGWVPQTLPFIQAPPVSQAVSAGQDALFAAGVTGVPAPTYQWLKDGGVIPGATGASLLLPAVQSAASGSYSVVVTNAAGSAASASAFLTIAGAGSPVISSGPAAQTAAIGDAATFSAAASGALAYQWLKDGSPIAGASSPTLVRRALQLSDGGMYAVVVSNAVGSAASAPVALSVHATPIAAAPTIQAQPASQLAFVGSPVTLSVSARAVPPPSYQWSRDGSAIAGANGATLTLPAVQLADAGAYTVTLTNPLGSVTSDPAVLSVFTPAHLITQQPQSQGVNLGATATLDVIASGPGPLQYQWRKNGNDIAGATASTLTIANAQPTDTAVYSVMVTSLSDGELSAPAVLTVTSTSTQLPPVASFNQEGFATMGPGTTGGGLVDPSDAVHYKVIDASTPNPAQTLRGYLESTERLVVELRTDVDLGALNNQTRRPLINPELIASNLGVVRVGSNKTLFSDRGATLRHGTLNIDGSQNIILRNLKFRGLWEWDDATQGQYDLQGWDFIALTNGARNVWIDHCDIGKAYDGQVDIVRGSDMVTVSWTKFAGDLGTEAVDQINYLESLYQANPADPRIAYYASLRQSQSVQQIVTHEIPQDKTSLVGNDDNLGAIDTGKLNVTYHHDAFTLLRQRTPRMRFGNAHVFDIFVDDTLSAPFPGTQTAVNSTTSAAVLVENSDFLEVLTPLMFSNGGRITQRGSAWTFGGLLTPFDPARLNPVDPDALVFNPPSAFAWTDLTRLPYAYTLDPVDFMRTNLNQVGTILPVDATDQALLRSYLPMTGPFTQAPPPAVTYALNFATSGSGIIQANPGLISYVAGSTVTLTAVADPGWQFVGWSGDLSGISNPATLVMDADKNVLATFIPVVIPPSITNQTGSLTANAGDTVVFSVTASGTSPLSYQWRKDGDDIPGATGPSLTLAPAQPSDAGSYSVEVSNAAGVATSVPATLTVNVGPTFLLQERFADSTRAGQSLPASAAWWASSNQFTATPGQATMVASSSRTLLAYFTDLATAPATLGVNQSIVLDFTVQFSGFDTGATVGSNTFAVGVLRSVANPAAVSGAGFTADGPPNTNARVSGDFGSNNPTTNVFNNYGGYAAMTYTGVTGTATPVKLYARTGTSASLLNSTGPFTQFTGAVSASTAMAVNTDYHGTLTLQNTGAGMAVAYTLKDATTNAVVMSYSAVQLATSFTQFDTVAFYLSKASASATYNLVIKAVDVALTSSSLGDAPTITGQPVSQTVAAGNGASFNVTADGTAPLSYQWQKNGSPIAGATGATLTLLSVQASDAAGYRVVVSNAAGSATSATAVLGVDTGPTAPSITSQPASQVVVVGGSAIFSVLATGSAPLGYQWYHDLSPLAGATSATFSLANVQHADAGGYSAVVSNDVGSTPTNTAVLTVSDTLPTTIYDVAGFAHAATGGGLLPESDPNYRKVFTADDLVAALGNSATKVIEVMNDLDLGFNEVPASARTGALRSASAPLLHPVLLVSGVSLIDIQDKNGLTIFSANGATIRHATFNVKRAHNVLIRNLKFDELWEWDESSKGKYDKQGWDFITVDMTSDDVWIDHCTFSKVYDGVVDIKGGTRNVTISWSSFLGDDGSPGSFVRQQIDALEANPSAYPMYSFLRSNGFSVDDIMAITRSQKKGHLVGANELDPLNAYHQVTLHHNYYKNMQDRLPRLRAGNAHAFDILVDNAEAYAAKTRRDAVVAGMTPTNAAKLNGSSATYSFDVTLNGSISTEGGAVLLEKSQLIDVIYPLRNNQKDPAQTQFTGKILALDTLYLLGGVVFRGDSTTPGSPLAPVPAAELPFSWNGFATLPYAYAPDDPSQLPALLTGTDGAGAGKLLWSKDNWLKTSY